MLEKRGRHNGREEGRHNGREGQMGVRGTDTSRFTWNSTPVQFEVRRTIPRPFFRYFDSSIIFSLLSQSSSSIQFIQFSISQIHPLIRPLSSIAASTGNNEDTVLIEISTL